MLCVFTRKDESTIKLAATNVYFVFKLMQFEPCPECFMSYLKEALLQRYSCSHHIPARYRKSHAVLEARTRSLTYCWFQLALMCRSPTLYNLFLLVDVVRTELVSADRIKRFSDSQPERGMDERLNRHLRVRMAVC